MGRCPGFEYLSIDVEGDGVAVTFVATRPDPYDLYPFIETDPTVRAEWSRAVSSFLARTYPAVSEMSGASRSSRIDEQLLLVENKVGHNPIDALAFWDGLYRAVQPRLRIIAGATRVAMQRDTVVVGLTRSPGGPWGVAKLGFTGPFSARLEQYLESVGTGVSDHHIQELRYGAINDAIWVAADLQAWVLKPAAFQGGNGSFSGVTLAPSWDTCTSTRPQA